MSVAGDGVLFKGLSFFVGQRVPTRSTYIDLIRRNGGELRPLEKSADIQIADHVRRSQNAPGTVSYEWIDKSIKAAELLSLEDFPAGPLEATPRPVGAGNLRPAKTSRNAYTSEDDAFLIAEVAAAERQGLLLKGNEIYKQIEAKNSRHPWQSWRDRWIKYLSQRNPLPIAGAGPRAQDRTDSTATPLPAETRAITVKKTTINAVPNLPTTTSQQPGSDPDFSIVIPQYTTPVQLSRTSTVTTKAGDRPEFTDEEDKLLMDTAGDIENITVRKYDRAWVEWGKIHTRHTTEEWKQHYETKIRPIYRQSAPDSANEEEDEAIQVSAMLHGEEEDTPTRPTEITPIHSPFVELMKKKIASPMNGKRKRDSPDSSPLGRSSDNSSAKKQRVEQSPGQKKTVSHRAATFSPIHKAVDSRIHLAIMTSEAEDEEDEGGPEPKMQDDPSEDDQPPTQVFPNDSLPWEGLSPEKSLPFKIYGSQDEFSEEGVENATLDADDISPGPRKPAPGALQVFADDPQDFLLSRGTQEESQEFYDAPSQTIDSSMDIVPKVAPIPTPDLFKRKPNPKFDISEIEEEEDSRSSLERDGEEIAAQLARENAYNIEEGNLADEDEDEDELDDDEDDDDGATKLRQQHQHFEEEDEDTPQQARAVLADEPIPDSDAILPPDESAAEEDVAFSPSPRKARTKPQGLHDDQDMSDLEDYTEMPLLLNSDIGNVDMDMADTDNIVPSLERYADTQAVLQADTQALDTDLALPETGSQITSEIGSQSRSQAGSQAGSQTLSQWAHEQQSQKLNSDIAPSSPAPRVVATSISKRISTQATASPQPQKPDTMLVSVNDEESDDGFEQVPPQATLPTPKPSQSPPQRINLDDESYRPTPEDKDDNDDVLPDLDDAIKIVLARAKTAPAWQPVVSDDDAPIPPIDDQDEYAPIPPIDDPEDHAPPQIQRTVQFRQPLQARPHASPGSRQPQAQPRQIPPQPRQTPRQIISIPSSTSTSTSTSANSPETLEEAFIASQIAQGHKERLVVYALQRTSCDTTLAAQVIKSIEKDNKMPEGVRGIWTDEDDRVLYEVVAGRKLSNLVARKRDRIVMVQGLRGYGERIEFLREMGE